MADVTAARQWGISSAGLRSSLKSPDKTRRRGRGRESVLVREKSFGRGE